MDSLVLNLNVGIDARRDVGTYRPRGINIGARAYEHSNHAKLGYAGMADNMATMTENVCGNNYFNYYGLLAI